MDGSLQARALTVAPAVVPLIFRLAATRRFMFRTVSQTAVNYRGSSPMKDALALHGGGWLPWVQWARTMSTISRR
jgi:hypothetical protein